MLESGYELEWLNWTYHLLELRSKKYAQDENILKVAQTTLAYFLASVKCLKHQEFEENDRDRACFEKEETNFSSINFSE